MIILAILQPYVFSPEENEYLDRFATLAFNIGHWFERDDVKEYRYLRLLWEIADNHPVPAMSDAMFRFLRDETSWDWLRHRHNP